ncbi:MAG: aminomethyl-transferring glycine dehydrogenase subunit GcvPA [Myxococcales bacterium]|nr:aminomethyl-transferring glycine dehydrogenase subunit GcvPA [Myxococcales bacterium]
MRYLPHTPEDIGAMLGAIGLGSLDELFESIPAAVRQPGRIDLAPGVDEQALMRHLEELGQKNASGHLSFLGAGAYDHGFPIAADQLLLRSELYTAYTPYQPEVAQGTLQLIFEFQTIVSEILGLPIANASMYDGSTAAAEAVLMARRLTGRSRSVVSGCVHPEYLETVTTLTRELDLGGPSGKSELVAVPARADGRTDVEALVAAIDGSTACVLVGYPSFFGCVSDLRAVGAAAHARGALLVTATTEPFALALCEPPGALGADIAVAEGQPLGLPPQYGGPGVGLFACQNDRKTLQQLPGRLCGETVDKNGTRGYVLTLSTREQHIRRERATSNICTNSGLCAAALTIKMCLLGKRGFVAAAEQCLAKAEHLRQRLAALPGYAVTSAAPTFNELAVRVRGGDAGAVCRALATQGIVAGLDLGRYHPARRDELLVAVTERHSAADLERLVSALAAFGTPRTAP